MRRPTATCAATVTPPTHLFRVASGLDSMVLGEAQIHGQVRDAWEQCRARSGPVLNRLFQTSLSVAGRVRSETSVARGAASVSSAAVQIAKQIFGSLAGKRAMVLGAGEMAELALECLGDQGVRTSIVANRTFERATEVAAGTVRWRCTTTSAGPRSPTSTCSSAPRRRRIAVVLVDHVRAGARARAATGRSAFSTSRCRATSIRRSASSSNVFLYNLDDLQAVVSANLERRRAELPTAEQLIAAEAGTVLGVGRRAWRPFRCSREMRARMEALRARELADALAAAAAPLAGGTRRRRRAF